jgi:hypothetical protein
MTSDDLENTLRDRLHDAIDPIVPGPHAAGRVMSAIADAASEDHGHRGAGAWFGRGLGSVLVASLVVVLVGGALGLSLALRGHPTAPGPSTHTSTPFPLPTATASPAPSPVPTPSPATGPLACEGAMLSAHFADQNGAAGTLGGEIVLQNSSDVPCTMDGYTNLRGSANGEATQLGVTHDLTGFFQIDGTPITPQLITLQPGGIAYVAFVYSDVQSTETSCPSFTALLVTPPQGRNEATMEAAQPESPFTLCPAHGAAIWVDEAPVSLISYFTMNP